MGYQNVTLIAGWSAFTPTFKNVGDEKFYLSQITPLKADGSAYTAKQCMGTIYVQCIADSGEYGTSYKYYSTLGGWSGDSGKTLIGDTDVPLNVGEGFVINNLTKNVAMLRVSGEVDLACKNFLKTGWSICGNSTPVNLDLTKITPLKEDGSPFTAKQCMGTIYIQCLSDGGEYGTSYKYYSTLGGWSGDSGKTKIADTDVPLPAGCAFAINNLTKSSAYLQLPSPVAE